MRFATEPPVPPRILPAPQVRWGRIALVWGFLAILMSANGALREFVIRPAFGDGVAPALSAALGALLIGLATRRAFPPLAALPTAALARVAAALVVATVIFETAVGLAGGRAATELASHYAVWRGELWPLVLASLAATPFAWGRWWVRPWERWEDR